MEAEGGSFFHTKMKRILIIVLAGITFILVSIFMGRLLPINLPASDFMMLYKVDALRTQGIPIYDFDAQVAFTRMHSGEAEVGYLFPYPYPPWYPLATLFLGLFTLETARRIWFAMNLGMLFLAAILLGKAFPGFNRIILVAGTFLFLPSLGILISGQYGVPVLLGAALFLYALTKGDSLLLALALTLMTFKPHVGGLLFAGGWLWLAFRREGFARRAAWLTPGILAVLAAAGFLMDSNWLVNYPRSVLQYGNMPGNANCLLCISPAVWIEQALSRGANPFATLWVSAALLAVFIGAVFLWKRESLSNPAWQMAVLAAVTLVVSPYLYNDDYILLILPFVFLGMQIPSLPGRVLLGAAWLLPYLLLLLGRAGNVTLVVSTLIMLVMLFLSKSGDIRISMTA